MKLALQNVRTVQTSGGARLVADLVATDYGFSVETSLWAECLTQYRDAAAVDPDHITKKALVKEAILAAESKLADKKVVAAANLASATAALTANPAPAPLAEGATEEDQAVYDKALAAHQQAQAAYDAAKAYSDALAAFEAEYTVARPVRVDAFYSALVDLYTAQGNSERATHVRKEWDAWKAAEVDASALAGAV